MAKRTLRLREALLFWNKPNGDSVAEEEDDDVFLNFQTAIKRPRRMTTSLPFSLNTMSDGPNFSKSSSRPQTVKNIPIKIDKNFHKRRNQEVKENDPDVIEVINLDVEDEPKPIERRPALGNLGARTKPRNLSSGMATSKTSSPHSQHNKNIPDKKKLEISVAIPNTSRVLGINVTVPEKKQNGVHSSLYNSFASSHLRPSRTSTPKNTALNQTYKYADKMKYSKLLAEYHNYNKNGSSSQDVHNEKSISPSLKNESSTSSTPVYSTSRPQRSGAVVSEVVDLTRDESGDHVRRRTHIPVKPYKPPTTDDDDIKIIEERRLPHVNSLERKLSMNCHFSPEWIADIQRKYGEKEREMRRQVEEEVLKKELYAKHNEDKRLAAIDERIRRHLKITDVVLDETEAEAALPELTKEMQEKIKSALKPNPSSEGLVEGFGQKITRRDIQTLNGLNWLNDEVINFYMNLIIERGKGEKYPSVYAFNTFFYPKLVNQGYSTLRRWTKKVDIFNHELLLVPIHLGMHWCMATVDFRDQTVRYYDSMGGENNKCLFALLKYLNEESMDKKKAPYDTCSWKALNMKDIPQQMNGSDCGMFSCMFAEYTSRNAKITFSQKDMPYFRRKMVYEILTKKLLL